VPGHDLPEEAVDRDQMLTDVTIHWLTGTADALESGAPALSWHAERGGDEPLVSRSSMSGTSSKDGTSCLEHVLS
jgi:hypothetical protein